MGQSKSGNQKGKNESGNKGASNDADWTGKGIAFLTHPLVLLIIAGLSGVLYNNLVAKPNQTIEENDKKVARIEEFNKSVSDFKTEMRSKLDGVSAEVGKLQSLNQQVKEDVAVLKAFPDQARTLAGELAAARKAVTDATAEAKKANAETATAIQGIEKRIAEAQAKLAQLETIEKGIAAARGEIALATGAARHSSAVFKLTIAKLQNHGEVGVFQKAECTFTNKDIPLLGLPEFDGIWPSLVTLSSRSPEQPKAFATAKIDPAAETLILTIWWDRAEKAPEDYLATVTLSWRDS
jgi:hypothetical protein